MFTAFVQKAVPNYNVKTSKAWDESYFWLKDPHLFQFKIQRLVGSKLFPRTCFSYLKPSFVISGLVIHWEKNNSLRLSRSFFVSKEEPGWTYNFCQTPTKYPMSTVWEGQYLTQAFILIWETLLEIIGFQYSCM